MGAAVNMGSRWRVAKRLKDLSTHLVSVHWCAHWLEFAIKTISNNVAYFKTLENTFQELYKLYTWPLCWSGLQEVGQVLKLTILKPAKLTGTRWIGHRARVLKILVKRWKGFVVHTAQVAQGSTVSKDRARHILKCFLFARVCNQFFTAWAMFFGLIAF